MSEKEIIKAVECCIRFRSDCANCPMRGILSCSKILRGKILKQLVDK